jgi:hypothetical protein
MICGEPGGAGNLLCAAFRIWLSPSHQNEI